MVIPFFLLAVWWVGAEIGWFNSYLMPHPSRVFDTAVSLTQNGILFKHLAASLYRVLGGFSITFAVAFPLAVILALYKQSYYFIEPVLEFIRHVPPIALIPILILWFGIGETSKLAVIFLAAFFPVFLNTSNAIISCDTKLLEVGKVFSFSGREQFFKIILPQALPQIMVGMQLALGYSWRSLIGAELIAASSGIGYMIIEAEQLSRPDIILVGIFTIGLLGYFIDYLFLKATGFILHWTGRKEKLWQE